MLCPATEIHVWSARLDLPTWPTRDHLPPGERNRATRIQSPRRRRRWVAARWALRGALARYLQRGLAEIELEVGTHGKPALAEPSQSLRFNLSHSGDRALIAIVRGREVGIDVQRLGSRPAGFYADWTRREAIAKCHGVGLWSSLPDSAVAVSQIDAGGGFAAAIAVSGDEVLPLRHFRAEPAGSGSIDPAELAVIPGRHP
jgi:4'-phosphopantetheinyl transferase